MRVVDLLAALRVHLVNMWTMYLFCYNVEKRPLSLQCPLATLFAALLYEGLSRLNDDCRVDLKRPFDIATTDCVVSGRVLPPTELRVPTHEGEELTDLAKLPGFSSSELMLDELAVLKGKNVYVWF